MKTLKTIFTILVLFISITSSKSQSLWNTVSGTSNIYYDVSGAKVGIGTDDPQYDLQIGNTGVLVFKRDGAYGRNPVRFNYGGDGRFFLYTSTDFGATWYTRFSVRQDNGFVGIGSQYAMYNLDVAGDINFTGSLYHQDQEVSLDWIKGVNGISYDIGNVSIGSSTIDPQTKLKIEHSSSITEDFTGAEINIENTSTGYYDSYGLKVSVSSNTSGNPDTYIYGIYSETFNNGSAYKTAAGYFEGNGSYGIGIKASSNDYIAVSANGESAGVEGSSTNGTGVNGSSTNGIGVSANSINGTALKVNGNSVFENGKVAIGSENTYAKLEIVGEGDPQYAATNSDNAFQIMGVETVSEPNPQSLYMGVNSARNISYIQSVEFGIGSSTLALNARGGGHVTIGTEDFDADHRLSVYGGIMTDKVTVKLIGSWSDYVFKQDYNLKSLKEVEEFINQNGHLPGVPSESEVTSDGIDVAEMNKILMEKVEELTLYMIDLKKKNEDLNKRIEQLENLK